MKFDHDGINYKIRQCTGDDAPDLTEFTDRYLRKDYFFKRNHWSHLISQKQAKVYFLECQTEKTIDSYEHAGIIVIWNEKRLHNLFIEPAHRKGGLGSKILKLLNPTEIRVKTNMSSGDPSAFYEKNGFVDTGLTDEKKDHIHLFKKVEDGQVTSENNSP